MKENRMTYNCFSSSGIVKIKWFHLEQLFFWFYIYDFMLWSIAESNHRRGHFSINAYVNKYSYCLEITFIKWLTFFWKWWFKFLVLLILLNKMSGEIIKWKPKSWFNYVMVLKYRKTSSLFVACCEMVQSEFKKRKR